MLPATFPILALLTGAAAELALGRVLSPKAKGWLAVLASALALVAAVTMVPSVMDGGTLDATLLAQWDAGLPIALSIDGLGMLFALMGTTAGTAILLFSVRYMDHEKTGLTRFYTLMLVFIAGLLVLTAAANLLVAYMAWEVIGLCSYSLVGFWYTDQRATDGARKVLVMTHLAGYGFLFGIIVLYARTGTFDWNDPAIAGAFTTGIAAAFIVAAMAKSVMFPLHTWIPEAMNAPTPVSALLHSACYVKAGVYLIARMYAIGPWQGVLGMPLALVGCATILIGVIFALAQTDLKRLLAFHTVSQLGYIVTGLALGSGLGVAAGLFYCLSHALFKGTLFMCAGAIQHATGTRDLRRLGGLASSMPTTAKIWIVAAAAIAGVPLTNGFVAKWLLFGAALDQGLIWIVAVGWIGSLLTAFSFLKATVNAFYGVKSAALQEREIHDVAPSMRLGMGIMAALCVLFGVAPQLLMIPVVAPGVVSLGFDWQVQTSWFGVLTDRGSVDVTLGAAVVAASVLMGGLAYAIGRVSSRGPVSVFSGGESLPQGDRPGADDFAGMAEAAFHPVYRTDPDPFYMAVWRRIAATAGVLQRVPGAWLEARPLGTTVLTAAIVFAGVWFA